MQLNPLLLLLLFASLFACAPEKKEDSLKYINSYIGSTGATDSDYGGTIPAVAPPFAMTQWVAMTRENYISNNPYNYRDTTIIGFFGNTPASNLDGGLRLYLVSPFLRSR